MRKFFLTALVCGTFLMLALPAHAWKKDTDPDRNVDTEIKQIHNKFKRGAINVVTSPLEIPKQTQNVVKDGENVPQRLFLVVPGIIKGVGYGVIRLASGLWDVGTFNINRMKDNEPILKPDYVWEGMDSD